MKNLNIVTILQGHPKGTPLYSPICGSCYLEKVTTHPNDLYPVEIVTTSNTHYYFDNYGRYTPDGEILLFPSKIMKDWSKFQFRKGDVLVNITGKRELMFDSYTDSSYTTFKGKHYFDCSDENNHVYLEESFFVTENYSIEGKDSAQCYINTIEERLGGKLNPQTLKIEKSPLNPQRVKEEIPNTVIPQVKETFKPFDKVLVRNSPKDPWRISIYEQSSKDSSPYNHVCINDSYIYCLPYEGNEALLGKK